MTIKPRIKLSHHVIRDGEGNLCIGEIPDYAYVVRNPPEPFVDLVRSLDGTKTVPRLINELRQKHPRLTGGDIQATLEKMETLRLVDDAAAESTLLNSSEKEFYNRQLLYFSLVEKKGLPSFSYQEALKRQRVAVLGLGGWGTWVSLNLSLAGFGALRIVDGDVIETSNLNRQILYSHEDLGQSKAEVAARSLKRANPHIDVEHFCEFVRRDEPQVRRLLEGSTMIVLAWANMAYFRKDTVEEIVHRVAREMNIPLIELGGDPLDVSVGPIFPNREGSPCLECIRGKVRRDWYDDDQGMASFRKARLAESFANGSRRVDAWQTSPALSVMAGLAVDQAIKLATSCSEANLIAKRFSLSLRTFASSLQEYHRDPACSWCGDKR